MDQPVDEKKSKYHGSLDYLQRLNQICIYLNGISIYEPKENTLSARINLWKSHYKLLKDFFKELSPLMDSDEYQHNIEIRNSFEIYFLKIERQRIISAGTILGPKITNLTLKLDDWEMQLRSFQARRGLLMPDADETERTEDEL